MPARSQQPQRGHGPVLKSGARSLKIVTPPPAAFTTPYAAEISRVEDELSDFQSFHETPKTPERHSGESVMVDRYAGDEAVHESPVSRPSSPPLLPPLSPMSSLESPAIRERSLSPVPSLSWSQGPSIPATSSEFGDDEDAYESDGDDGELERGSPRECSRELAPAEQQEERRARAQTARSSRSVRIVGGEVEGVRLSGDGNAIETTSIGGSNDKTEAEDWPLPSGPHNQRPPQRQKNHDESHVANDKPLPRLPPRAATVKSSLDPKDVPTSASKLHKPRPLSVLPRSSTDTELTSLRPEQLKRHSFHVSSAPATSYDDWGLPMVSTAASATSQAEASPSQSRSSSPTNNRAAPTQQRRSKTKFPSLNNIFSVAGGSSAPMSLSLVSTTPKTSPTKESLPEFSPFGDGDRASSTTFTGDQKRSSVAQPSPRNSNATLEQYPPVSIVQGKGLQGPESVSLSKISQSQPHSAVEPRPTHHRRTSSKLQAAASFLFGFGGGSGGATSSSPRSPVACPFSPPRSGATSPLRTVQHQRSASSATSTSACGGDRFKTMEYDESDLEDDDACDEEDEILNMDISKELRTSDDATIEEVRSHTQDLLRRMQTLHTKSLQDQYRQRQHLRSQQRDLRLSTRREVDRVWHMLDMERQQGKAQEHAFKEDRQREVESMNERQLHDFRDLREELEDAKEREHHLKRQLNGMAGRTEALEKEVRTREAEIERLKWCLGEVKGELTDRRALESGLEQNDDMRIVHAGETDGEESMRGMERLHRESRTPFMRSEAAVEEVNVDLKRRIKELEETLSGCLGLMD